MFSSWLGIVEGVMSSMAAVIDLTFGSVLTFVGGFVEGFIGFFINLAETLGGDIVPGLVSDIWTIITEGGWEALGKSVVLALIEGVESLVGDIADIFKGMVDNVKSIVLDTDWAAIGDGIMSGILKGLKDGKDSVTDWLVDMAKVLKLRPKQCHPYLVLQ